MARMYRNRRLEMQVRGEMAEQAVEQPRPQPKKKKRLSRIALLAAGAYAMLVLLFVFNSVENATPSALPSKFESMGTNVVADRAAGDLGAREPAPEHDDWFYYSRLSDSERIVYTEILRALERREDKVLLSTMDEEMIDHAFNCVMNDHPELFYVSGYTTTQYATKKQTVGYGFSGRFSCESDEADVLWGKIEDYVDTCFAGLAEDADEYETARYIYEYLIDHTVYVDPSPDDQNICSVFLNGKSICMGYARATQFLLQRAGLSAALVTGKANTGAHSGVAHAWDLVRLDGAWYYIDTTWGDTAYASGAYILGGDTINYDYLLVTSEDLAPTHTASDLMPMPVCKSISDNYYVREGAYFYDADFDAFAALTRARIDAGERNVSCKCADEQCFSELGKILFEDNRIFECVDKAPGEKLSFLMTPEQRTITVWFN